MHDPGAVGPRSSANSFQQLKEQIQTGVAQATSHTETLQDMVLRMSQDDNPAADPQKGVLKDLVKEMISFRQVTGPLQEAVCAQHARFYGMGVA